jgi:hypothetical protein
MTTVRLKNHTTDASVCIRMHQAFAMAPKVKLRFCMRGMTAGKHS